MTSLQTLDLQGMKCNIGEIGHLRSLTDLRELTLSAPMTPGALDIICGNLGNLEKLVLTDCYELTDAAVMKIHLLKRLKSLTLQRAERLTDLAFTKGLAAPCLEVLSIIVPRLTDKGLRDLAIHHNRLRELYLFGCRKVTDEGVSLLVRRQTRLRHLGLASCRSITDRVLVDLAEICPKLQLVNLSSVPSVTPGAKLLFERRRPDVKLCLSK